MNKKECCPVLTLALDRAKPGDQLGLKGEVLYSGSTGHTRTAVVLRFRAAPKACRNIAPHGTATFAEVNFCPFCGKKFINKKAK